ncbi:MAG: histidine kinase [Bacteroidales bacterium]
MQTKLNHFVSALLFSGFGVFSYLLLVKYTQLASKTGYLDAIQTLLFFVFAFNIMGFSTIQLSTWMNKQYVLYIKKRWKIVFIYGLSALLLLLMNYGLVIVAKILIGANHPFSFPNGGLRILIVVWLVELVIMSLLIANQSMQNALRLQQQASNLQSENNIARYTALQNQLNPHFLFNSLNTLIAEIEYDPQNAIVFTQHLSNVYRYVLQCQNKPLVSLGEELEFMKAYLFLHEVRLGKCIRCQKQIPSDYMESMLPPLTLQLLIENVIKHNIINANNIMYISISIEDTNLIVSNSVSKKKENPTSGVGLKNLSNRCKLILNRDLLIICTSDLFTVKIPLLYD